jgi:hypothetical protein
VGGAAPGGVNRRNGQAGGPCAYAENEAGIARLPNLFTDYFDAGGDIEELPRELQARLCEATAHWLLPSEAPPQGPSEAPSSEAASAPPVEEAIGAMRLDEAASPSRKKRGRAQAIPSPSVARVWQRVRVAMCGSPSHAQASPSAPGMPPPPVRTGVRTGMSPPKALFG